MASQGSPSSRLKSAPRIIGALLILGALTSCDDPNSRVLSWSAAYGQVRVWTDPETGCEYFQRDRLTPRLDQNAQQICRAVTK